MHPLVILSGGKATRLGDFSANKPKCLLPIGGQPFIVHQLNLVEEKGIKSVTLCLGHLASEVVNFVEKKYCGNLDINFSFDGDALLGTGGAVKKSSQKIDTPFFVMYGDSYLDISFKEVSDSYMLKKGPLMVIYKNNGRYDRSNVHFTGEKFIYRKSNPNPLSKFVDYGLSIFEKNHFDSFHKAFDLSLVHEKYCDLDQIQFFETKKRFYEIGSIRGLKRARIELPKKIGT